MKRAALYLLVPTLALADLSSMGAQTAENEGVVGRTLWVLGGHYDEGRYWASAGTIHAALAWALSGGRAEGNRQAAASSMFHANVENVFRARFGVPLVRKHRHGFTEYDGDSLRAAFRAIYVPPTSRVSGRLAKDLYRPLRGFVAEAAQATACMLDEPKKLDRIAGRYRARGRFSDFDGADFDCVDPFQFVTAGVILRRRLDGTLPVLLEALRTVLRDYDPETFAELDARLRLRSD